MQSKGVTGIDSLFGYAILQTRANSNSGVIVKLESKPLYAG